MLRAVAVPLTIIVALCAGARDDPSFAKKAIPAAKSEFSTA